MLTVAFKGISTANGRALLGVNSTQRLTKGQKRLRKPACGTRPATPPGNLYPKMFQPLGFKILGNQETNDGANPINDIDHSFQSLQPFCLAALSVLLLRCALNRSATHLNDSAACEEI